jgi:hypothetical protein
MTRLFGNPTRFHHLAKFVRKANANKKSADPQVRARVPIGKN